MAESAEARIAEAKRAEAEKAELNHNHNEQVDMPLSDVPPPLPPNKPVTPPPSNAPNPRNSTLHKSDTIELPASDAAARKKALSTVDLPESGATRSITVYAKERLRYVRTWGSKKVRNMRALNSHAKKKMKARGTPPRTLCLPQLDPSRRALISSRRPGR